MNTLSNLKKFLESYGDKAQFSDEDSVSVFAAAMIHDPGEPRIRQLPHRFDVCSRNDARADDANPVVHRTLLFSLYFQLILLVAPNRFNPEPPLIPRHLHDRIQPG